MSLISQLQALPRYDFDCDGAKECKSDGDYLEFSDVLALLAAQPEPTQAPDDDLGLSLDMLDVDRLRDWARLLLIHGPDIGHWGSVTHVAGKMQMLATNLEKAIRDIGQLRSRASAPTPSAWQPQTPSGLGLELNPPLRVTAESDNTLVAHNAAALLSFILNGIRRVGVVVIRESPADADKEP